MKRFGLRMDGNEVFIENLIKDYITKSNYPDFKYLEIGAAGCVTLRAIYDIVKENIQNKEFITAGIDLCEGWSLDWDSIRYLFPNNQLSIFKNDFKNCLLHSAGANARLILTNSPREFIQSIDNNFWDIVFIDGCHGRDCVIKDFLAVKDKVKKDGILFFHDSGLLEQGTDWQHHCKEPINVRRAILDLGLWDNKNSDWKLIGENLGSRFSGGTGNSTSFFRKL